ncbi:MAG: polysaccharide deacetylase family protein [Chloroflexota bacterium]
MYILAYHEVTNKTPSNVHTVTTAQLRDQLQWLTDNGFLSASLDMYGQGAIAKSVVLTFDDAYVDFFDNALPILQQFRFGATVFIISDLIGKTRYWSDGDDYSKPKLMNWEQIGACQQAGIKFGSHTATHPNLTTLTQLEIKRELFQSRTILSDKLGYRVDYLCYPYGLYNANIQVLAKQVGYKLACASRPFFVGKTNSDRFALDRISMLSTDTVQDFAGKMRASLSRKLKWYRWLLRQTLT